MDAVVKNLRRVLRPADSFTVVLFVLAALYALVFGTTVAVAVGVAFGIVIWSILGGRQISLALLVAASVIVLLQPSLKTWRMEGFADTQKSGTDTTGAAVASLQIMDPSGNPEEATNVGKSGPEAVAGFANPTKKLLPDNTDRKEPLVLGAPYKLPSESDDKGYHLDAGTTFLNAYKALKPDQIAAMTRDTQELLATQKSLMQMLDSFGPLMKDMGKITGFFNQLPGQ